MSDHSSPPYSSLVWSISQPIVMKVEIMHYYEFIIANNLFCILGTVESMLWSRYCGVHVEFTL